MLEQYDKNANTLSVNGIVIPLKEKYVSLMELYLKARQVILDNKMLQTDMLFVNKVGKAFNTTKSPDYGALFHIAEESIGSVGMERYASNRIVKMIARGVDVSTLVKLTGVGMEKIFELLEFYNGEVLKARYQNRCQICGFAFEKANGKGYSEAYHVVRLADNGSQDESNVVIVCANHHRMFHYAKEVRYHEEKNVLFGVTINGVG